VKKGLCAVLLSLLLAGFYAFISALPVYAASTQTHTQRHPIAWVRSNVRVHHTAAHWYRHAPRHWRVHASFAGNGNSGLEINQYHRVNTNHDTPTITYGGHGQGNSGKTGYNRSRSQDNSANGGNQITASSSLSHYRRFNQYAVGDSNYRNSYIHYGGYNQGNTGNSGQNEGLSQDNSANGGNQLLG